MSATDHKEQATSLLESIELDTVEVYGQAPKDRRLRMELAQIHATLYAAEQQRIANVMAYYRDTNSVPSPDAHDSLLEALGLA